MSKNANEKTDGAMYAIIKTGGKQYRVSVNDVIDVELLGVEIGKPVEFLALFTHDGSSAVIGQPHVEGCVVQGQVIDEARGPKILSMKYKPSHNQRKTFGHRQHYSRVKITAIGDAKHAAKHHHHKEKHHGS